jgi:hypothetical protein
MESQFCKGVPLSTNEEEPHELRVVGLRKEAFKSRD